ncbi:hypothetical protein J2Y46_000970 [Microbacterium sp. BE35]|uniref:TIR domain-containing protein n=1 Tax=Microbacterium sp. BE35 TaxID=2817773 RepID=UPI00285C8B35|nr:TIR domain-containing protein [Microbacterium sp. BE35]MDR7188154.1 hypothetical protein [Microbacterium sp. BE35]
MQVFISWSGEQTRQLGHALKAFLETTFAGHVRTFLSDADVAPGERFLAAISSELDGADLGLLLVTRANQHAPWLLFEAGALAGKSSKGSVIPILIDLDRVELDPPLSQFQNVLGTSEESIRKLCHRIRADGGHVPGESALTILFREAWPALEAAIASATAEQAEVRGPRRGTDEMLGEILLGVNALVRRDTLPARTATVESWSSPRPARDNGDLTLHVGEVVVHDDFGRGVVQAVTDAGLKSVATIVFDAVGSKKILVRIAPITVDHR